MQRYRTQSDDCAEDEVVSPTTSKPCHNDDNYHKEYDQNEDGEVSTYSHSFTGAHVDPRLATLLSGPQWKKSNPHARRAARVDYSYKSPSQTATRNSPRKPKYCAADDNRAPPPVPEPETLARWNKRQGAEFRSNSSVATFIATKDDLNRWAYEGAPKPRFIELYEGFHNDASQAFHDMRVTAYAPPSGPSDIVQEYLSPDDPWVANYQDFKILTDAEKKDVIAREAEEHGLERPKGWNVSFHYNPHVEYHHFGSSHPMKPWRLTLTKQLVLAYGLEYTMDLFEPRPASFQDLAVFHDREYLAYLSKITPQNAQPEDPQYIAYGFGGESNDCPVFDGLWNYVSLYTGATMSAAYNLINNQSNIAINWSGGLHHAKKNLASGFCYVNDIVIAIQTLLSRNQRVLYIDIDVHHGDGVEQAFESTDRVFTLSYHKYGIDKHGYPFFPGTGAIDETGPADPRNPGKAHSLNIPIDDGIDDDQYKWLFKTITGAVIDKYNPQAIVLQSGADSLGGDRLGRFNLNIKAHGYCVETVKSYGRPLLIIGGGGYTPRNVARTWCHETSVCVGATLHNELPAHVPYLRAFQGAENGGGVLYPDLHNTKRHDNLNSQAKLHKLVEQALENLRYLEGAPSVVVDTKGIPLEELMRVREAIDREMEEEAEDKARLSVENSRRRKEKNIGGRSERR
ncbi:histone deacetylase HOS2 [Alternaria panax]|uniref:histone deacetylase n=1 Tax=Alternaria panax TaxID=48097 RepID=A0AAD4NTP1_9PLEO|nr:histone deacetylase HOS2 [Alternaria panax]